MGAKVEGTAALWETEAPGLAEMLVHLQSLLGRILVVVVKRF